MSHSFKHNPTFLHHTPHFIHSTLLASGTTPITRPRPSIMYNPPPYPISSRPATKPHPYRPLYYIPTHQVHLAQPHLILPSHPIISPPLPLIILHFRIKQIILTFCVRQPLNQSVKNLSLRHRNTTEPTIPMVSYHCLTNDSSKLLCHTITSGHRCYSAMP